MSLIAAKDLVSDDARSFTSFSRLRLLTCEQYYPALSNEYECKVLLANKGFSAILKM